MIGHCLRHTGNGKFYVITGFAWLGEHDEWGFLHHSLEQDGGYGIILCRPLHHINGNRSNGEPRYWNEEQGAYWNTPEDDDATDPAPPVWEGPGETPHNYFPDMMAMGDCIVCGHVAQAHKEVQ